MDDNVCFRLKSDRLSKNIGQKSVADKTDVSVKTVGRWEDGTPIPSDKLALLADIGIDVLYVLTGIKRDSENHANKTNLSDEEFALIPVHDVEVSAGDGRVSYGESTKYHLAYRKYWLKSRGLNPKDLHVVIARGDSMQPTIDDGESLLVNTADNVPKDGHIYVIRSGDTLWVKRIQKQLDGKLLLISDNTTYPAMPFDLAEAHDVQVVGKVVNSSKNFY